MLISFSLIIVSMLQNESTVNKLFDTENTLNRINKCSFDFQRNKYGNLACFLNLKTYYGIFFALEQSKNYIQHL